ncbi:MAG: bifunctional glutamate N-acetyltransferase/amino-acid acetyltransferase ArgJ [Lachnospiraceae bacterium]|nr:bifunctional glutamate N-acetyltransferase/amino-acid acetyltransferase ArgJ [Lachnospiraceae bacterium]
MKFIDGGVTAAKGFEAASTAASIKYKGRTDMALIYSLVPCISAGTFTTNVVKAAPVIWDKQVVESGALVQAVVVNSGIANACTGQEGMDICKRTARATADALNVDPDGVLVASTGVIGMQLPMDRICEGIKALANTKALGRSAGHKAALAIMTTDTKEKEAAVEVEIGGRMVTIGGMSKGSGMIHPNMCTMLAFLCTDAAITKSALQKALSEVVNDTYNMISVDGDTSTNDTCLLLANGLTGNPLITEDTEDYETFKAALYALNEKLAKKMAGDGEGATALLEVRMTGCESVSQARIMAKSVVCSSLVKTAIAGRDANWGRILCAMGYSGEQFDPEKVDLYFESAAGKICIVKDGVATDYSEEEATEILKQEAVSIIAHVHMGSCQAVAWGCDLTHGYIDINADYRS